MITQLKYVLKKIFIKKFLGFLVLIFFSTYLSSNGNQPQKIGLALSGGGARGLAHIGVLKVIDEVGLKIDCITGTSMGGIIGALYSTGFSGVEIEEIVLNLDWRLLFSDRIMRKDLFVHEKRWLPFSNYNFFLDDDFKFSMPTGFIAGQNVINKFFYLLYEYSHIKDFSDFNIPVKLLAVDLLEGSTKVFSHGEIHEVIRASMSIPSIFQPFNIEGSYYIDGGILANFPTDTLIDEGVDYIIGVQLSSELRGLERLNTPLGVLDQTLNIGMTDRTLIASDLADLLIIPELSEIRATDFDKVSEIISIGENAARKKIDVLKELAKIKPKEVDIITINKLPEKISFKEIIVEGNVNITGATIRRYLDISTEEHYYKDCILEAINRAYVSNLFYFIYPVIQQVSEDGKDLNDEYVLIIKVKEKPTRILHANLSYNSIDNITLSTFARFRNELQRNSDLFFKLSFGGRNEFLTDYVKNFGHFWGIYYRLFNYIFEHKLFIHDENHQRLYSLTSLEYGSKFGIGVFARDLIVIESFMYYFRNRLYRHITEHEIDRSVESVGLGIKIYHESLDDFVFPMKGRSIFVKLSSSSENFYSDIGYNKAYLSISNWCSINSWFSVNCSVEFGSFFSKDQTDFDPFYIGGLDSFMGLSDKEISAPNIKILRLVSRFKPLNDFYVDFKVNTAYYGETDKIPEIDELYWGAGVRLGYDSLIGPLRVGAGIVEGGRIDTYISLGYDFDPFMFSRR